MKLELQRETLLKPLQMVMGVVERKQTLPILANVLLKVSDKQLSITGTDLEIELVGQSELSEPVSSPIQLTIPGRKLLDICRALPEAATIKLSQEKQQVILKSGRSRFALSTLPAEDFPNTEEQSANIQITLQQQDLRYLLHRTYFAMAQQDVRYYLNGLLLEITPKNLRAVATDGHRLAANVIDAPIAESHRFQVIMPRKGVLELQRLLNDSNDEVTLAIGNNYIQAIGDNYTFTSKLVEGRFPDYQRVIPKTGNKSISFDREIFKQALSRSAILCNEKFRGVNLELKPNMLRILAQNPEQEAAEEELNIDYTGEDFSIAFNVNYLLDVLNTLTTPEVQLTFSGPGSSVLITEPSNQDSTFVVMPMRM